MHDIKAIRQAPDAFDANWAKRGIAPQSAEILRQDEARRAVQTELQELQNRRNTASKAVGEAKRSKDEARAEALMAEVAEVKERMTALEDEERLLSAALDDLLGGLPNQLFDDVPVGDDEEDNELVRTWGEPKDLGFEARQHFEIGESLGLMDFESAAYTSGARFVFLHGELARLERALTNFMLDLHTSEHGLQETVTPYLVRDNALYGTGQLPKFEEDLFKTQEGFYLIPTSEVPLTNLAGDQIIDTETLPHRYTAFTPCFRSEAGSAGRDTRGLVRLHQFNKVEMVSITTADQSEAEHERMTQCAEVVLQKLGLAYRVMKLCTGDMGFGMAKTYDLEVWLPGQNAYREISSCSNARDFQARRMKARCRAKDQKETQFVHTLNGSGVAVGRAMVAVIENYQREDGSVLVPEVLVPYMGGKTKIEPKAIGA